MHYTNVYTQKMNKSEQLTKAVKPYENDIGHLDIYECYKQSPYRSAKHSTYFQVYAGLLEPY